VKKLLRRILLLLGTGSISVLLAACYGVPFMYGNRPASIRVLFTDSANRLPIPGLKVNASWLSQILITDTSGRVNLSTTGLPAMAYSASIIVQDIDGIANQGDFSTTTQEVGLQDASQEIILTALP
jgi:hypothetical protein